MDHMTFSGSDIYRIAKKIIEEINILWNKWEQARTYEEKLKFLKENFHIDWLTKTEIESLTKEQINTLKELKDLWFSLSIWNISINLLKLKLTNNEINTLRQLKDLWVNIFSYTNKLSKLKPEEINTLRQLKDLWVDLSFDVKELSNFTPEQINTLKKVKELWVNLGYSALELSKLTSEQINTLKELKKLWIDISEVFPTFWRNLISYKSEELLKLKELKDLWINVNKNIDLEEINDKIMQTLKELKKLWFNIKEFDLSNYFDMVWLKSVPEKINKIKKICNLWIKRNKNTLFNVRKIAESDINIIEKWIKNLDNALKIKENELEWSIEKTWKKLVYIKKNKENK